MGKHGKNYIVGKAIFLHFTKTISGIFTVVLLPERKIYVIIQKQDTHMPLLLLIWRFRPNNMSARLTVS